MSGNKLGEISHVLFDLDGLLIDTETVYTNVYTQLAKEYGKQFKWHLKALCMGLTPIQSANVLISELKLPLTPEELVEEEDRRFNIGVKDAQLMPGAERLVKYLHRHNIPMAIATGSTSQQFVTKTEAHKEFFIKSGFFKHIVCAGDDPNVKRGKPFPDVFIEAMRRFGSQLKPQNVLVFEDSPLGVKAALAAEMPCVWVPDPNCDTSELKATLLLKSLEEFNPQLFGFPTFDD